MRRDNRYTADRAELQRVTRQQAAEIREMGKTLGELRISRADLVRDNEALTMRNDDLTDERDAAIAARDEKHAELIDTLAAFDGNGVA